MDLDKLTKRVEELKHNEDLLGNCIEYLCELWSINNKEELADQFKKLGFTEEDLEYWYIK